MSTDNQVKAKPHSSHSQSKRRLLVGFSALAGVGAAFAPAQLTGSSAIDAVQRAAFAAFVTYVGAHGRRRTWLLVGALAVVPANGASLVLALTGLAIVVASTRAPRRSRGLGAAGLAFIVNATLWYPPHEARYGLVIAIVASVVLVTSGWPQMRAKNRRAAGVFVGVGVGAAMLATGAAGVALLLAAADARDGGAAAQDALESARAGDATRAKAQLGAARDSFDQAGARLRGSLILPGRFVPVVAQQLHAVRTTVDQGSEITLVGNDLAATADYERLKYDGRLDLVQLEALLKPTARADDALASAAKNLAALDAGWLAPPLRSRITQFSDQIDEARRDTRLARSLVRTVPSLLGADGDRRYLIIFLTPSELRGAGGFIGSYAELTAVGGDVNLVRSGRIDDLINAAEPGTRTISGPEDYLRRYGRFRPQDYLQDVTFSPNFPSSAAVMAELYPQSGGTEVDGVIGVDPTGLAALLELTGPVMVEGFGEPLSAENAVEVLTRRQYLELGTRAERGEFLTEAASATFERLIDSQLPAPRTLANVLSPATRAGHLRLWSPTDAEQDLFEVLGADGTLEIERGHDGFSFVQQNAGNNKIDAYIERSIQYRTTVDATSGALEATLRLELHNALPPGQFPPAVVDNSRAAPPGTNVGTYTIHTPHVVTSATLDGSPILLGSNPERGLRAWDTPVLNIGAGKTRVLELRLTGNLDLSDGYQLTVLPQPVANPDQLQVSLGVKGGTVRATGGRQIDVVPSGDLTVPVHRAVPLRR